MTADPGSFRQSLAGFLTLVLQFSAALGVVASVVWFLVSPRVEPYLDKIEQIDTIVARLDELEQRTPTLNIVAFSPTVEVEPAMVRPGEDVVVRYQARVLFSCRATVMARFFDVDRRTVVPRFNREFEHPAQPVGETFEVYSVSIGIPDDMDPGSWTIKAQIIPADDCPAMRRVIMPEADFTVLAPQP